MDYKKYTELLNYLMEGIRKGQVASPCEVAKKFSCSEKTIRRMINHLRDAGHCIKWSKQCKKYLLT